MSEEAWESLGEVLERVLEKIGEAAEGLTTTTPPTMPASAMTWPSKP